MFKFISIIVILFFIGSSDVILEKCNIYDKPNCLECGE